MFTGRTLRWTTLIYIVASVFKFRTVFSPCRQLRHTIQGPGYFSFCCCCFVFLVIRLFRGESFLYRLTMRKSFIQLQEVEVENNNNEKKKTGHLKTDMHEAVQQV